MEIGWNLQIPKRLLGIHQGSLDHPLRTTDRVFLKQYLSQSKFKCKNAVSLLTLFLKLTGIP